MLWFVTSCFTICRVCKLMIVYSVSPLHQAVHLSFFIFVTLCFTMCCVSKLMIEYSVSQLYQTVHLLCCSW